MAQTSAADVISLAGMQSGNLPLFETFASSSWDSGMVSEVLQFLCVSALLLAFFAHLRTAFDIYGGSQKWGETNAIILKKKVTWTGSWYYTYEITYEISGKPYTSSVGTQFYNRNVGGNINVYFNKLNPHRTYTTDVFVNFLFCAVMFAVFVIIACYLAKEILTRLLLM